MKKKEKEVLVTISAIIIGILILVLLFFFLDLRFSGYTITSLNKSVGTVNVGDVIQINVSVYDITNLSGVQINITYDENVFSYNRTEEATFLNESGTVQTNFNASAIDTTVPGSLGNIIIYRQGEEFGVTGSGVLFYVYFNATTPGYSAINISRALLSNNTGGAITSTLANTSLTVSGDFIAPTVRLFVPANLTSYTTANVTFNGSASDNVGILSVTFILDNLFNETNSSGVNSTSNATNYIFQKNVSFGNHTWRYQACDTSNNCTNSSLRTFSTVDTTNPGVTINAPTAGQTVSTNNVTINISFSDNSALSSCSYNVTNSTGGTVVATNSITCTTNSVEYQTIVDGSNYVLTTFANDTAGNTNTTNVTFSIDTAAPVLPSSPSGGGGGGSGGTTTTTTSGSTFSLSADQISVKLKRGETKQASFTITNTGGSSLDFSIISDFEMAPLNEAVTLAPEESHTINLELFAGLETVPDFYIGKINVTAENTTEEILISVEVTSEEISVLVEINLDSRYVYTSPGEKIVADVVLTRIKELDGNEVNMIYTIKNEDGQAILTDREVVVIEDVLSFSREFNLPKELPYGRYVLYVQADYQGEISSSSRFFSVEKRGLLLFLKRNWILVSLSLIILVLLVILIIRIMKRRGSSSGMASPLKNIGFQERQY
jgi:hypothetical protein